MYLQTKKASIKHFIHPFLKYGAFLFILFFAVIQFVLILRHKSPYLSDSYFYKHIFYQFQGNSFDLAYQKVMNQINLENADEITRNIFSSKDNYSFSYSFFTKRPLYPFTAYFINLFLTNEFLAFLIPIFFGYLAVVILVYFFTYRRLGYLGAVFATALFISFYPFLDWSTYFLTDTIGAFFWFFLLFSIFKFLMGQKQKWLYIFLIVFSISLTNREQSLLMVFLFVALYILLALFKFPKQTKKKVIQVLVPTFLISLVYIFISYLLNQRTTWESLVYLQNNWALYDMQYKLGETLAFILQSVKISHIVFVRDLVSHHWWFAFFAIACISIFKTFFFYSKKPKTLDLLILCSALSSYLFIFIYPLFSYRFFFPILLTIVYFAVKFILEFFEGQKVGIVRSQ